jgi:hypothetical protein
MRGRHCKRMAIPRTDGESMSSSAPTRPSDKEWQVGLPSFRGRSGYREAASGASLGVGVSRATPVPVAKAPALTTVSAAVMRPNDRS